MSVNEKGSPNRFELLPELKTYLNDYFFDGLSKIVMKKTENSNIQKTTFPLPKYAD